MRTSAMMLLLLSLLWGCAGEVDPSPAKDGSKTVDQGPPNPDKQPALEWGGQCKDGDKRCSTLFMIQECNSGTWVDSIDCSKKKLGSATCICSMTLLYNCAVGVNLCN